MATDHLRFDSDNEVTDSEDEHEKELMERFKNRNKDEDDSEEEHAVYDVNTDSEDDKSDIAASDIGDDDDDLPNVHAWGKEKYRFFGTDYVDQDYGTYEGRDAEQADLEETEAKLLQKELIDQFSGDDFSLNALNKLALQGDKEYESKDVTKLSKQAKESSLIKATRTLIEDVKSKMETAQELLIPIISLADKNKIKECSALHFVKVYYEAILKFQVNISVYLVLQNSNINLASHPIVKRLYQWKQLFMKMDPIFEDKIKLQLKKLLENSKTKKTLKVLSDKKTKSLEPPKKKIKLDDVENDKSKKGVKFDSKVQVREIEEDDVGAEEDDMEVEDEETNGDSRRAINYQIAKNKGLTPRRNKQQRNPRVKYRNKYMDAKKRRRGQVRDVRKETNRYAGEISGIKITSRKSIQIK